jgi:hypothetical protein
MVLLQCCILHQFENHSVHSLCIRDVQKDFVNWYQKMAVLVPQNQPTSCAAVAPVASSQSGHHPVGASEPVRGSTSEAHSVGSTLARGTPLTETSSISAALEAVPEHQPVSQGSSSTTAMALATSRTMQQHNGSNSTAGPSYRPVQGAAASSNQMGKAGYIHPQSAQKGDNGQSYSSSVTRSIDVSGSSGPSAGMSLAHIVRYSAPEVSLMQCARETTHVAMQIRDLWRQTLGECTHQRCCKQLGHTLQGMLLLMKIFLASTWQDTQ